MKKIEIIIFMAFLFLLCGCSAVKERVVQILWENSGVPEDASYIQYREMEDENNLNEEGLYHSDIIDTLTADNEPPSGSVHVSFARNDFLHLEYYINEAMDEKPVNTGCYVNPGDTIYVSEVQSANPNNPLYKFSEIQVREIDENADSKIIAVIRDVPGLLFHIPEDYKGTELSVVPIGKYEDRTVILNAVYVHPDGTETVLENGIWEINGKRYGNETVKLNPMESYRVVFDYSAYKDGWYFSGSNPEAYWDKSSDATITFLSVPSNLETVEYKVSLHPYGTMTIKNGVNYQSPVDSFLDSAATIFGNKSIIDTQNIIELLQVNNITNANNFSDTEITLSKLKSGDEILIRVPEDLKIIADGLKLPASEHREKSSREYLFAIPDTESMSFQLSVTRRNSDPDGVFHQLPLQNGELAIFDAAGLRYTDGSELPSESEKITVTITPVDQYCIYGKNVNAKDNVYRAEMKYSEFESNLQSILADHPIRPGIVVTIDTEDDSGNCVFWTGTEILTGTVVLREGQDLQFDYVLDQSAGYEIVLSQEERVQLINVWSPYAASRTLEVTDDLQGKVLRCRDFVTLKEGVKTNDFADPY